jgi:Pyruvate/2-oxoacid:ferredoxin oxidoreductase delta subunit
MQKTTEIFLEERLDRYDEWLDAGQISFSSKVVPVSQSLEAETWVLPSEQVMQILRTADFIALTDCECRTHYGRCDNPVEVCLLLDDIGEEIVSRGQGRHLSLTEAGEVVDRANDSGLVHLSLYRPDHRVYAVCSCCSCCCHDLQIVRHFQRDELMVRSEYVAVTDEGLCIHCGDCIDRCVFGARAWSEDGEVQYDAEACFGCGLCVTSCPTEATRMTVR